MERFLARYKTAVAAAVMVACAVVYALLSLGNHHAFRTYGLDLGLYTNALYDYAHLQANDCTFFLWQPGNLLADHFDLYLVLLSPLVYLFGEYTLLLVQLVAVLLGMWGICRLACLDSDAPWLPLAAMLLLGAGFGMWHALAYDYHSNVVSAMLLPWLVYCVRRRWHWGVALLALLMSMAKETSALWVVFVLLALMCDVWSDRHMRRLLACTAAGCAAYFLVVALWLMPSLGGTSMGFWRYSWMGGSMGEVALWLLSHPLEALRDVFVDFTADADCGRVKAEFFVCALLSGGLLTLFKPNYLLMLVPPVAMKMLASDTGFWGVTYHYNVEVTAVVAVAAVAVMARWHGTGRRTGWVAGAAVALTLATTVYTTGNPYTPIRKANVRVAAAEHYRQHDFDAQAARRMIAAIPDGASVCATTMFTPHLAVRDSAYIFPMGLAYGAEYYLLLRHHWCYYEGEEEQVAAMVADTAHYAVVDSAANLVVLRRR